MTLQVPIPPTYTYISPGLLNTMRREVTRFLLHTYTRTERVIVEDTLSMPNAALDAWGQQNYTFDNTARSTTRTTDIACFYAVREVAFPTSAGLTTLNRPMLTLNFNDPLQVGDHVSEIRAADRSLLVAGPLVVESLQPGDPNLGGPVLIEAILRDIQYVPTS